MLVEIESGMKVGAHAISTYDHEPPFGSKTHHEIGDAPAISAISERWHVDFHSKISFPSRRHPKMPQPSCWASIEYIDI